MPSKAFDELIDSGKEKEVYRVVGCKNPKHDPYEVDSKDKSKCNGCSALRTEKKEPEIKVRDFPHGAYVPLSAIVDETIYHCRIEDYISARKELKKVFPSNI